MIAPEMIRKLTAAEFLQMAEAGVLDPDERVELLEGQLYVMTPQSPDHSNSTTAISDALRAVMPDACRYKEHSPLHCGLYDLPEPDVAVIRDGLFMQQKRHPQGNETYIVVEIAKTSLSKDRAKAERYAAGGVPLYWLVDLEGQAVEIYELAEGAYTRRVLTGGAEIKVPATDLVWTAEHILTLAG